ncbi:MAG: glycoside hydrolase family 15 protein [Candidatus Saccharimonadales bacterium]
MARLVMLGNGSLTVGLNEHGLVHDFYYPYVGLENLTTARSVHHMIGVWVDNSFSWVDDGNWDINVDFSSDSLVSLITMVNNDLGINLHLEDFVDSEYNALCRKIQVTNNSDHEREIRIFMHQVFEISRAGRADTALFVPEENYILDYKGRCSLLVYGQDDSGQVFDQFAIGNYGIEGKEGTFKDAEDGILSGSAVEHGGVDSVLRFVCCVPAKKDHSINYWIIAADTQITAEKIHHQIKKDGLEHRLNVTKQYWHEWLAIGSNKLHNIDKEFLPAVKKSLMIIKAHTDKRGGIIASCDSSIYNYGRDYYSYVWPRDGAYAIWPLIRLGYTQEPRKFFEFCRDILTKDGYLMHKYQPDRAIGSTWHPLLHGNRKELAIQEDETAIVLYMIGEYLQYSNDIDFVKNLYTTFIQPAADFMYDFIDEQTKLPHASYDLWEEKFLTNTYTVATVYQALLVASDLAEKFDYPDDSERWSEKACSILDASSILFDTERQAYRKGYLLNADGTITYDNTLDLSNMYGPLMFGLIDNDISPLRSTVNLIEKILLDQSPSGGSPRYESDHYFASTPSYQGNPWFVTTLWLAQYYIRFHDIDKAKHYLQWTLKHALSSGVISEQINPTTGEIISVTPLVWSHAEVINTALDLSK